jgi:uncharacterized protein YcfJ
MCSHRNSPIRAAVVLLVLSGAAIAVAQVPPPASTSVPAKSVPANSVPTSSVPANATPQAAPAAPVIYPAKGQSDARQAKDKNECYGWATKQTGYDPVQAAQQQQAQAAQAQQQAQAAQSQQQPPQSGHRAKGAAGGAIAGTAIGAVAGDAGKGAAIGATTGALVGGARKRREATAQAQAQSQAQEQAAQTQSQQNAQANQKLADYTRNFAACMQGRGYTVK